MTDAISCPACSAKIPANSKFCPSCGKSTAQPSQSGSGMAGTVIAVIFAIGAMSWFILSQNDPGQDSRQQQIESQFSALNGSHRNLVRTIQSAMNNPDSFEHVETGYSDDGDSLRVQMVYRGENAFGGTVTERVTARISLEGTVLEILE
jgi:hypothetical protein